MTAVQVYAGYVRDMMNKQREFGLIDARRNLRDAQDQDPGSREWLAALRKAREAETVVWRRTQDVLDVKLF